VLPTHETRVDEVVRQISAAASFSPLNHALEIEGRCSRCS
jgi:Fe2+ or Zn2+ uptake regulation protein